MNWKLREQGDANHYAIIDESERWLAAVQFNGELLVDEQRSKVRQMASAPELLASLKDLHSILLQYVEYQHGPYCDAARAAIAKAEGFTTPLIKGELR